MRKDPNGTHLDAMRTKKLTPQQLSSLACYHWRSLACYTAPRPSGCHSPTAYRVQCICRCDGIPTNAKLSTISCSSKSHNPPPCWSKGVRLMNVIADAHSLCYFVNILDLVWLWVFPQSTSLFIASYLLTMGQLPAFSLRLCFEGQS